MSTTNDARIGYSSVHWSRCLRWRLSSCSIRIISPLTYIGLAVLVGIGLVVLTGVARMTSFGQAAFCGLGGLHDGAADNAVWLVADRCAAAQSGR